MWRALHSTKRCELFNELSKIIWDEISDYHRLGCDSNEPGITKYILREFRRFSTNIIRNFQVYAKPGYKEALYGSDIDLYIGIGRGRYRWIALQAKLLKVNGKYNTMKDGYGTNNPNYQWEKLALLEAVSGCKSYYLFYNGSADGFRFSNKDKCRQEFNEKQFGCSLVDTAVIKNDMDNRLTSSQFRNPEFTDYHPNLAIPWRTLVCCPHRKSDKFIPYYREDIEESIVEYEKIESLSELDNIEFQRSEEQFLKTELEISKSQRPQNLLSISDSSIDVKWNPQYKIVLNTTTDSKKYA